MNKIFDWINGTPVGVAVKVGVAAVLSYVLTVYVPHLDPVVAVGLTPVLVALVDWFNPNDPRFGHGSGS